MIMQKDYAFEMATSGIRFGPGITAEIGMDLVDAGLHKPLVITDPHLAGLPPVQKVLTSLDENKIACRFYQGVCIEPTDRSIADAIRFAQGGEFDCIVAVGGGSSIDTAKAVNLFTTYPADFLEYVNAPIGRGKPVPGPLKPLFAIPTTSGTGSETTGISIFNLSSLHAKTGIAHRQLKPYLGLIDPENTRTMPAAVVASTGLDVLSHAVESYTAIHYRERPRPERPLLRPCLSGFQSPERHLVAGGAQNGKRLFDPGLPGRKRPGSARHDALGRRHGGGGFWQCRGPPPPRHVLSGFQQRARFRPPRAIRPIIPSFPTACRSF